MERTPLSALPPTLDSIKFLNIAMLNHTSLVLNNMFEIYKGFGHIKQLVDVGDCLGLYDHEIQITHNSGYFMIGVMSIVLSF